MLFTAVHIGVIRANTLKVFNMVIYTVHLIYIVHAQDYKNGFAQGSGIPWTLGRPRRKAAPVPLARTKPARRKLHACHFFIPYCLQPTWMLYRVQLQLHRTHPYVVMDNAL